MGKDKSIPSPFQRSNPESEVVAKILRHIELLKMPVLAQHLTGKCSRDCHIIERNHVLESVKHFIENGCMEY